MEVSGWQFLAMLVLVGTAGFCFRAGWRLFDFVEFLMLVQVSGIRKGAAPKETP